MVQDSFKLVYDAGEYQLETANGDFMPCPECIINEALKGKYIRADRFIDCQLIIALAGVTNSLRMVDQSAFDRNSVLKKIYNMPADIDSAPDEYESVQDYEKYHTIKVERDIKGDDNSLHAYITTSQGKLRVRFPNDIRLDAKRNNRSYWVENYKIQESSAGGKHVIPLTDPVEF